VKFAAVLDNNGKLIVGKFRKGIHFNRQAGFTVDYNCNRDSNYLFYLDYVVAAIKKRSLDHPCRAGYTEEEQRQQRELHFEITEIDKNVRLGMAPLTERNDKYLCIYFESSAPYQEIISKLGNAII
jgi:hypothetical protein